MMIRERAWFIKTEKWLKRAAQFWPILFGFVAAFGGILIYNAIYPPPQPLNETQVTDLSLLAMASATPPPANEALVYNAILPSLVLIHGRGVDADGLDSGNSLGTGVVVNEAADILTAYHVVDSLEEINITFADGTEATAVIASADSANDIAVLSPSRPPELLVPATLGSSNGLRIGDAAYAVGNPFGLAASMSSGVISGFDRSIPLSETGERLDGLIQFDTAVNPGSSGGPLLNRNGQVVGIVTALANPSDQNFFIGIGFAVPISTAGGVANAPPY